MRIIDSHTHVFPDHLAEHALSSLSRQGGISPFLNGTADALTASMQEAGITYSIVLPVATSPTSVHKINLRSVERN